VGGRIGPYKLLQLLGEGGMGVVYLAEQEEPVKRRVALKVVKAGMDSARVLTRFEAERQALALMDHPNIARVLDADTTAAGRPYFVMELVKGIPFTRYCDQEHLTPQERLGLFVPVCQAVQHAHQKGVIHRDLKPSNVLVALYNGVPVPKVIDFGVAEATAHKLTERTMFTEVGQIVGTLEYMAPEQAELNNLDVDTRADIYSLGVIVYELLTGSPPFTATQLRVAAFTEVLRILREVEPPKPSTRLSSSQELPSIAARRKLEPKRLTKLVRGELDWIVMKALEKDRTRRYATANGLARDVQRYLADESVEACPPSAAYRLKKFARKHTRLLATSLAFALLLAGATAATTGLAVRATRAERRAERDRDEAVAQTRRADEQAAVATAVSEFVQKDLLGQASPEQQARPDVKPDRDVRARVLLHRAAAKIGPQFEGQPLVEAQIRGTLADSNRQLGQYAQAELQARRACQLFAGRLGPEHPDALRAQFGLALVLSSHGRPKEAADLCRAALEAQRRVLGAEHPDTLRAVGNVANMLSQLGRAEEARRPFEEALEAQRRTLGPRHPDTVRTMSNLAWLLASAADPRARDPGRAVELAKDVLAVMPTDDAKWNTLGVAHYRAGDWAAAIAALEKAEALAPGQYLAHNGFFLAMARWQRGEKDKARDWYDRAARWMEKNSPDDKELQRFRAEAAALVREPGEDQPPKAKKPGP
jgi:serine/threonine protein kinase/tetratricopeptide (TPR) repeat protein